MLPNTPLFRLLFCLFCLSTPALWAAPARWISLAPSLTETIGALGLADRLIAVTDYCVDPESVRSLPKIGGYLNPSMEAIVALKPDLVWALPEHETTATSLRQLGIKVNIRRQYTLGDLRTTIQAIAEAAGVPQKGRDLTDQLAQREAAAKHRFMVPPRVLLVLGYDEPGEAVREVFAVGRAGFLHELLLLSGAENAFQPTTPTFPKLDAEGLTAVDPERIVILFPHDTMTPDQQDRYRQAWRELSFLKAVKENKLYFIHHSAVFQPGPSYVKTLEALGALLSTP
ncbi:ABC transporter substrate-binding protein [Acanthopleuribacter pedis]|uniref:ABC transporter substrate-binding protein n=1 Tax=Acanthopleuribacter pedis TaxID=442870 RepID=A0A8J7QFU7_9BACT|nr:helical backbone metal receptor [Acanthopleuribacter pedis]MBO1323344.1 ABC transporter substrate-binding protein [Acanthopleuribacter pedis]